MLSLKEIDELISSIKELKPLLERMMKENSDLRLKISSQRVLENNESLIVEEVARMKILNDSLVYSILTDQVQVEDIISAAKKDGNIDVVKFWSDKKSPKYLRN